MLFTLIITIARALALISAISITIQIITTMSIALACYMMFASLLPTIYDLRFTMYYVLLANYYLV